jgi:hypothetical protein
MDILEKGDARDVFRKEIKKQGRSFKWIADELGLSNSHVHNIMKKREHLTEDNRQKLNKILNTNI